MGIEKLQFPHGVCLCLGYDGTGFHGWQAQPGLRTVQGMIEEAIDEMGLEHSPVKGCSRTDAGVHALGQLASFACTHEVPPEGWVLGLNARLPDDIVIHDARPCFRRYNPRFHAAHKRYRYLVRVGRHRDPLLRKQAWQLGRKEGRKDVPSGGHFVEDYLDVNAIRLAAKHFLGREPGILCRLDEVRPELIERHLPA